MRFQPSLLSKAIIAASFAVAFAGCGGGGHHHDETHELSGTAASGAPIIGQVTVKDANGTLKVVDIEADGHYSVDVSDLTAPFLLRAAGKVGGRSVTLISAATSADLDGTINITPFTDLIVANIAGQVATAYFDTANFSTLSTDQLNAAKTTLTQRLQPILTSMGISDGFDLLRTSFAADRSGFDAVMDVVRVTVDVNTGTAQIRDLINNTQISDNLASATDDDALPAPAIGLAGVAGDLAAIDQIFAALQAKFAAAPVNPDDASLQALFVTDGSFLDSGKNLESFLEDITSDEKIAGVRFSGITILERIDENTLHVGIQLTTADGSDSDSGDFIMKKIGGVWKIAGNQRWMEADVTAVNSRNATGTFGVTGNGAPPYSRYLSLHVNDAPGDVMYVAITGHGLTTTQPQSALLLHRSVSHDGFSVVMNDNTENDSGSWIPECGQLPVEQAQLMPCVDFSLIGVNTVYTFTPLDVNGAPISDKPSFTQTLPAGPLSNQLAEAGVAQLFASVTAITPANYSQLADGTTITFTLSLPAAGGSVFGGAQYSDNKTSIDGKRLNSDGTTVDMTWEGAAPTTAPRFSVWTSGDLNRQFVTNGQQNTP